MKYDFDDSEAKKLEKLMKFMLLYNERINLTAITERDEVWEKHFNDSALPLKLFDVPRGTSVVDIGTGAGFPGLVWKICRSDLDITLLDSLRKRTDYLSLASNEVGVPVRIVNARAEGPSHEVSFREKFEIAVSRAVANLPALLEYCLPYVRVGGYFLAMKGAKNETEKIKNSLNLLGGKLTEIKNYELSGGDKRSLIIVKKISHTPPKYPRKNISITKNPL